MVRRSGAPPLRFLGHEVSRRVAGSGETAVAITLWKRKTRGFVAAIDAGLFVDSASLGTLEEAMDWMEDVCGRAGAPADWRSLGDLMAKLPAEAAAVRELRVLVGQALDDWDRMSGCETS